MTKDKREQFSVNISNVDNYPGLSCPRIELFMIDKKQPGRGFETMGGGGNPFGMGTYCPTGSMETTGADYYSSSNQSLTKNKRNLAMNTKFEGGGRVSVFVCCDFIDADKKFLSGTTMMMCRYVGPYTCMNSYSKRDERKKLQDKIDFYESIFPQKLHQPYINFRLKRHYVFEFKFDLGIPFWGGNKKEDWSKWTHLHVRSDDKRKLCMEVPASCSMEKIFSLTETQSLCDEDTLYETFFNERHFERLTTLCTFGSPDKSRTGNCNRTFAESQEEEQDAEVMYPYSYQHVPTNVPCEPFNEQLHGGDLFRLQVAR